jgi:hypothetical protein
MRHPQLARLVIKFLAILPAALIALLILKDGVDFPFQDQWVIAPFFNKFAHGALTFNDLFALLNEHRQFFPNIFFVALGWLTHWNVKVEMWVTFLVACLISFNIYRLGVRSLGNHHWQNAVAFFFANLLIFSPIQFYNWQNGEQLVYFVPIACLTTCLSIAHSENLSTRKKFLLAMCLATLATFSCANGILCWVLALPVLGWSKSWPEVRAKKGLLLVWFICFALNLLIYFHGYHKPADYPNPLEPLMHPLAGLIYFFAFLGATLTLGLGIFGQALAIGLGRGIVAVSLGFTFTSLFVAACFYFLKHRRDEALISSLLGWLMIGAHSVLTATLITFGRAGFGGGHALITRYTTFSLYLIVALVYLVPLIFNDAEARGYLLGKQRRVVLATYAAALLLIFLQLPIYPVSLRQADSWRRRTLQAQACTLFVNIAPNERCLSDISNSLSYIKQTANELDELKLLRPRLIQSNRTQDIAGAEANTNAATATRDYGSFDSLATAGDGIYVASGRAILPERSEAADAVLLAYRNAAGEDIIFALATTGTENDFITLAYRETGNADPHWQATFNRQEIPAAANNITAWAFDAQTGKLFPLNGTHQLP